MAAPTSLMKSADATVTAREIDFITRFQQTWEALREIMGITRMVKKQPGTSLTYKYGEVTLASSVPTEGDAVTFSQAKVKTKTYGTLTIERYAKAVSGEAILDHGYDVAVALTDQQFLNELQGKVLDKFYTFLGTGTLTSTETAFQMAVAMAIGKVRDKFKTMRRDVTAINVFVNTIDAYKYLGAANLTVQNVFGMQYVENFMGADRLILTSEIDSGKVIATPSDNMVLYYIDPNESDLSRAGIAFRTLGETPLIGFHVEGNYTNWISETYALMGMGLFAEYLDGIAVITVQEPEEADAGGGLGG